ncbi:MULTISPECIES: DUF6600 domain-containing protein [Rhodonellum]|nr:MULTISPECIES: DUF6600 domain-containing protein [Rhodonellum]SDY89590.1 hypothetical protein SAMN05444412_103305 [Rhodonellum ikkaensis]
MKKTTILNFGLLLMLTIGMAKYNNAEASQPYGVNFQIFYNELSPYGDWVMDQTYGYVWIPNVDRNFHPYSTNGYWTMTNYGNTWVSDYSWGWAPFHYGRWLMDDFYGWAWVPGYEWGPAWVNWRTGGGYYGWSPLAPGIGINVSINFHRNHWVFVPQRRFRHRNFHRYHVPSYQVVNIYNRTTIINNTYVYNNTTYVTGPSRREVEKVTKQSVPVYEVRNSERAGRTTVSNNSVAMYRPEVNNSRSVTAAQPKPSRAFTAEEYRSKSMGTSINNPVATPSRNQANTANANGALAPERTRSIPSNTAASNQQNIPTNRNTRSESGNIDTNRKPSAVSSQGGVNQGTIAPTRTNGTRESAAQSSKPTQERISTPAVRTQAAPVRESRTAPAQQTPRNSGVVQGETRSNQRVSTAPQTQNRNNGTVTSGNSSSRNSTQASQPTRSNTRVSAPTNNTRGETVTTGSRTTSTNRSRGGN